MRLRASLSFFLVLFLLTAADLGLHRAPDPAVAQGQPATQAPYGVELVGHLDEAGSGLSFGSSYAYMATPSWQLTAVDVSNPTGPLVAARYYLKYASSVLVYGQYAYVTAGLDGIHILDLSNPLAPREVGVYPAPAGGSLGVMSLKMPYLYLGGTGGVHIVDVSNPASPVEVGSFNRNQAGWGVSSLVVAGNYLYVSGNDTVGPTIGRGGMRVIDVSVPSSPKEVGYYLAYQSGRLAVSGNRAYLLGVPGLYIIDIQDPTNPVQLGVFSTDDPDNTVSVAGRYGYLVSYSGLHVIDVSNPASPTQVAFYATPASGISGITLAGLYIYLSDSAKGISILRFSDAASALEARSFLPGIMVGDAGP